MTPTHRRTPKETPITMQDILTLRRVARRSKRAGFAPFQRLAAASQVAFLGLVSAILSLVLLSNFSPANAQPTTATYEALSATQPWFTIDVEKPKLGRNAVTIYADADFGASPDSDDNTLPLNAAIAACKGSNETDGCIVTFKKKGLVYKVNGGPDGRSINIVGHSDFIFDGANSTFIFSRPPSTMPKPNYNEQGCTPWDTYEPGLPAVFYGSYFAIDQCTRCELRNVKMDWDWNKYRLANLVRVSAPANNNTWNLEFQDVPSIEDPRDTYAFKSIHTVDPATNTMGNRNGSEIYVFQRDGPTVTRVSTRQLRLDFVKPNERTPDPGTLYLLRHFTYEFHAVLVFRALHLSVTNVKIFSCAGKAFVVGRGSAYVHFDGFYMGDPGPDDYKTTDLPRHITCSSDGLFFDSTKGHVLIENSEISRHGDDCVNFNSPVSGGIPVHPGIETINSSAILVRGNRYIDYFSDDSVSLLSLPSYSLLSNKLGTIKQAKGDGCGNWTLNFADGTFNSAALQGQNLSNLMVTNNEYDASKLIIRNLYCHHNRARGVLVQGNDVVVTDSRFENIQMGGILVRVHGKEGEGSGTENVLIARNTFNNVDLIAEYNGTAVSIYGKQTTGYQIMSLPWGNPKKRNLPGGQAPNRGISVRDNTILNTPRAAIEVSAAQQVLIQNNTIKNTEPLAVVPEPYYVGEWKYRASIMVRVAADVTVRDNKWIDSPYNPPSLGYIETPTCVNVNFIAGTNLIVKDGSLAKIAEINVTSGTAYDIDSRTNGVTTTKPSAAAAGIVKSKEVLLGTLGVVMALLLI